MQNLKISVLIELYYRKDVIDGTQQNAKLNLVTKTQRKGAKHVQNR